MTDRRESLARLFKSECQLPTLPAILSELNALFDNPSVSNKCIAQVIMKDQAMVSRVLQLSNSAFYAKRQEIRDLTGAVTFLGLKTMRNLVLMLSLMKVFPRNEPRVPEFQVEIFWQHSLAAASFSAILAEKIGSVFDESYFIAGLLHDIGKLVIYHYYPDLFVQTVLRQIEKGETGVMAEERVLEVNHADIGAYLAEKWRFQPEIVRAIQGHHGQSFAPGEMHVPLTRIANLFAKAAGFVFPWDCRAVDIAGDPAWQTTTTNKGRRVDIQRVTFELYENVDKVRDHVNMMLSQK